MATPLSRATKKDYKQEIHVALNFVQTLIQLCLHILHRRKPETAGDKKDTTHKSLQHSFAQHSRTSRQSQKQIFSNEKQEHVVKKKRK